MLANALEPGDELVVGAGHYFQNGRRAVTARGTAERPIVIRAAHGESPLFSANSANNCIEFVDCAHLVIRGLHFRGGSSGVRFVRGEHVTFEDCEISETQNNALTMNSGNCHAFVIRRNHIHHTGLNASRPTEGEGMYIGCHDGSCRTTDSVFEGNYIHHTRGTSDGGNDGIEIKAGSHGNIVRNNVIHDTNIERKYPGIFVYGGGARANVVEGNVIWRAGEGIQVVSDAVIRNNVVFDCETAGITAGPHAAMPQVRNVTIVNNTVFNAPVGVRMRWAESANAVFANNAIYCPASSAIVAEPGPALLLRNYIHGGLRGVAIDDRQFFGGGEPATAFVGAAQSNFWPAASSPLIGAADDAWAPAVDFNGTRRIPPFDAGAYETDGHPQNIGWRIESGFRSANNAGPAPAVSKALGAASSPDPERHYVILRRGALEAVVVDNAAVDDAVLPGHRAGYHGLASLKHTGQKRNIFVPAYSGLNFEHIRDGGAQPREVLFEPRFAPMKLRAIGDHAAELHQPPTPHWGLESWTRYELLESGAIEMTFACVPRRATWKNNYLGLFWASYIDKPESLDIHFLAAPENRWIRGITPSHGVQATHRAANDDREFPHDSDFPLSLVFGFSAHRYSEPWYFGTCRGMALAQMFRRKDQVRFSQSPSGGGSGNPAWDFQFFIPEPKVGRRYELVMRALYMPMPEGSTAEEAREEIAKAVRSALPPE